MTIFILLILIAAVITGKIKQQKAQADAYYWESINTFEAQRKEQILLTAIKKQQQENAHSHAEDHLKQAS